MSKFWKENSGLILGLVLGIIIGVFIMSIDVLLKETDSIRNENTQLERELAETKEQLMISNNELYMIEMKNEGIEAHE